MLHTDPLAWALTDIKLLGTNLFLMCSLAFTRLRFNQTINFNDFVYKPHKTLPYLCTPQGKITTHLAGQTTFK